MHCPYCAAPIEILTAACPYCGAATLLGERYEIRARIGRGGMGEVFRAYDRRLDTDVALKRLPPQFSADAALRSALTREAQLMARLSDAAIVRLFDLEEFGGHLYLILEYVPGPSLAAMLKSGYRATLAETAHLLTSICNGLRLAHRSGIVHRDLKPSNLLLVLQGTEREAFETAQTLPGNLRHVAVKIADFGIAKAVRESRATFTGEFVGTPGYTAPEQLQGAPASAATDVYALGVLTCELLTRALPAGRAVIEDVPAAVSAVITKACAFDPAQRYPSVDAFQQELSAAIDGRPLPQPVPRPRRNWLVGLGIMAAALGIMLVIGVVSYLTWKPRPRYPVNATVPFPTIPESARQEFHAPPRVDTLPPVIETARGADARVNDAGPRKPRLLWAVPLPLTVGMRIAAIGVDGTVYLTGLDHLLAVRDGKVRWGFKLGIGGVSDLRLSADGRIWFNSGENLYCLNRDGAGGRVPREIAGAPPRPVRDRVACVFNGRLHTSEWNVELDAPCTPAGALRGADNVVYAAIDTPEIQAFGAGGRMLWKAAGQCSALHMAPLPGSGVVFTCQERTIQAVRAGRTLWTAQGDGRIYDGFLAAGDGTVYFGDYTATANDTHLHAVDAGGRELWRMDTLRVSAQSLAIDQHHRLYVSGSFLHGQLLCLGD